MNIKQRITNLEKNVIPNEAGSGLITLALWKEYADGKDILPKLNEKQKQGWLEAQKIGNFPLTQAAETMAKFED
jgi:hypothetical protein